MNCICLKEDKYKSSKSFTLKIRNMYKYISKKIDLLT
jgi:hypothetical protein